MIEDFRAKMDEHARQLRAMHAPPPAVNPQLQALIEQEVARQLQAHRPAPPAKGHVEQALLVLLERSLKPEEFKWIQDHIAEGAPGFVEFLQSGTLKALVQMGFEAYTEFLSGERK